MSKKEIITIAAIAVVIMALPTFLIFPALNKVWDFSETGQIGDTIGGIMGPFINLFAAVLVFISFKEQVKANHIQSKALQEEKTSNQDMRELNRYQGMSDEIKTNTTNLEFIVYQNGYSHENGTIPGINRTYRGLNAIDEYVQRLENPRQFNDNYSRYGLFLGVQYILSSILEFCQQVDKNVKDKLEREFLLNNMQKFYQINLKSFTSRMAVFYNADPEVTTFKSIKEQLDAIFEH
jgi:hypothetical protein